MAIGWSDFEWRIKKVRRPREYWRFVKFKKQRTRRIEHWNQHLKLGSRNHGSNYRNFSIKKFKINYMQFTWATCNIWRIFAPLNNHVNRRIISTILNMTHISRKSTEYFYFIHLKKVYLTHILDYGDCNRTTPMNNPSRADTSHHPMNNRVLSPSPCGSDCKFIEQFKIEKLLKLVSHHQSHTQRRIINYNCKLSIVQQSVPTWVA